MAAEESSPEVLYETRHNAYRPYSCYPPLHQQSNEGIKGSFISLLSARDPEIDGLRKRLKLVHGHIEAGMLLAFYQVPKPINFFLEAHSDGKGVKQILQMGRV